LAFLGALIFGALAWPQGDCSSGAPAIGNAPGKDCHNEFGEVTTEAAGQIEVVIGFASLGAMAGALVAFGLVALGLFNKRE
jgi:hypothetical protein